MIADLKPYPEYKNSDSPWLGRLPAHWQLPRLGSVLRERGETNEARQVDQVLSVMKDIGVIRYEDKGNVGNKKSEDTARYKVVRPDDIVVNCMNVIIGSVGLSRYTGCLSPVYYVLTRRSQDDEPRYLNAVFQTKPFQLSLIRIGNGILAHRMRIPMELLKCEPFPIPPSDEQAAIVRFLDHANRRLERTIQAKRKVIALLNEQKQAIIYRAVTRGLDPNVPLKPSGIPWLGDIPAHWEVISVGAATSLLQTGPFGSQLHSHEYVTGGTSVINPSHMRDGRITPDPSISVTPLKMRELERHRVCVGDIVAARRGELGRCALVTPVEEGWLCGTGSLLIRCKPSMFVPTYFQLVFSSRGIRDSLSLASIGATMDNLNGGMVARLRMPLPPLPEQHQIVELVETENRRHEVATSTLRHEIALLREYRTRLIVDVVTGKLDVRAAAANLPDESSEPEALIEADALADGEDTADGDLDAAPEEAEA